MGSINDKLTYLKETKSKIKEAIVAKGVTVDEDATFRSYSNKIAEISTGETYTLPVATADVLGGVKVGDNLSITDDGTLSVDSTLLDNYLPLSGGTVTGDILLSSNANLKSTSDSLIIGYDTDTGAQLELTKSGKKFALNTGGNVLQATDDGKMTWCGYGIMTTATCYQKDEVDTKISAYLPLTGGELTGALTLDSTTTFKNGLLFDSSNTSYDLGYDWSTGAGAGCAFRGASWEESANQGAFVFWARKDTSTQYTLIGNCSGKLTWVGNEVLTTSTAYTKTEIDTKIGDIETVLDNIIAGN